MPRRIAQCVRPVVVEGVKRNERENCRGGVHVCYDEKEHPTPDGTNPAKTGSRRPVGTGASMLEVDLDLSVAVVFGRAFFLRKPG